MSEFISKVLHNCTIQGRIIKLPAHYSACPHCSADLPDSNQVIKIGHEVIANTYAMARRAHVTDINVSTGDGDGRLILTGSSGHDIGHIVPKDKLAFARLLRALACEIDGKDVTGALDSAQTVLNEMRGNGLIDNECPMAADVDAALAKITDVMG